MASANYIALELNTIANKAVNKNRIIKQEVEKLGDNEAEKQRFLNQRKISIESALEDVINDTDKSVDNIIETFGETDEIKKVALKQVLEYLDVEASSTSGTLISNGGLVDVSVVKANINNMIKQVAEERKNINDNSSNSKNIDTKSNISISEKDNIIMMKWFYDELSKKSIEDIHNFFENKFKGYPGTEKEKNELINLATDKIKALPDIINVINIKDLQEQQIELNKIAQKHEMSLLYVDILKNMMNAEAIEKMKNDPKTVEDLKQIAIKQTYSNIFRRYADSGIIDFFIKNDGNISKIQQILIDTNIMDASERERLIEELRQGSQLSKDEFDLLLSEANAQIDYLKEEKIKEEIEEANKKGDTELVKKLKIQLKEMKEARDKKRENIANKGHTVFAKKDNTQYAEGINDIDDLSFLDEQNDMDFLAEQEEVDYAEVTDKELHEAILLAQEQSKQTGDNPIIQFEDIDITGIPEFVAEQRAKAEQTKKSPPAIPRETSQTVEPDVGAKVVTDVGDIEQEGSQLADDVGDMGSLLPSEGEVFTPTPKDPEIIASMMGAKKTIEEVVKTDTNEGGNGQVDNNNEGKELVEVKAKPWDKIVESIRRILPKPVRNVLMPEGADAAWPIRKKVFNGNRSVKRKNISSFCWY